MEGDKKVFNSDITRIEFNQENNLNDLLQVTPANPIQSKSSENETSYFRPLAEKYYVPKKTSQLKVRTVREIRNTFEQDNYKLILEDLENQKNMLFTKIKSGSANDEKTRNLAKKILAADHPISRTAWQMIKNINPDKHFNPTQFVLWNGRRIKIMGTKGGRNRFISNYDLGKNISNGVNACMGNEVKKHRGLLRNSLNIKFKPGPLQRKQILDDSHQKYHMGPTELVIVPKPALDIQPAYGIALEPIMTSFLYKLRAENGVISKTWAEFAVSVLGKFNNENLVHIDKDKSVTFDLSYKYDQNRILMRKDIKSYYTDEEIASVSFSKELKSDNTSEVKDIMDKILTSVEISINQYCMYSIENDESMQTPETSANIQMHNMKEKVRKKYGELDRLDVTVIQLPGTPIQNCVKPCGKPYCNLGCICDSLQCQYKLKQHCGLLECMFGCKCEFSKYKQLELLQNGCAELIPGLINLDSEINRNLAKEEQKFHQTVVVSGEKSIVLKSTKRNTKSSRKYAEFYSNMRLKSEKAQKKILTVMERKLNCNNIEPFCMIHNLYKCFCKGRFTESTKINNTVHSISEVTTLDELNSGDDDTKHTDTRTNLRPRARLSTINVEKTTSSSVLKSADSVYSTCARTNAYFGRKHDDSFYKITNFKILEMEENDTQLHQKMIRLQNQAELNEDPIQINDLTPIMYSDNIEVLATSYHRDKITNEEDQIKTCSNNNKMQKMSDKIESIITKSPGEVRFVAIDSCQESSSVENISQKDHVPFELSSDIYKPVYGNMMKQEFLVRWMTKSYQNFIQRLSSHKTSLESPKKGKIILHSWEFVLRRYRERKNMFMVSKNKPFRIFMAREVNNYFFENCINIDTIRFADLHKYPFCVKNLLTNATSEEHFCILGGWEFCWELVGSVKQSGCRLRSASLSSTENFSEDSVYLNEENLNENYNSGSITSNQNVELSEEISSSKPEINSSERSKWFLLILENDFTEIHCHIKGFYVKRDKILEVITASRHSGKTIVINVQTSTETSNLPFGIYAIPDLTEYSVCVGPYEMDEPLGLEILKTSSSVTQKSQNYTRGVWITTNKVDNMKVFDDPLSFISQETNIDNQSQMFAVETRKNATTINNINNQPVTTLKRLKKVHNNDPVLNGKIVKPIKLRRVNGLYHLSPKNNILQPFPNKDSKLKKYSIINPNLLHSTVVEIDDDENMHEDESSVDTTAIDEPVADNVSQLKIVSIYSENITGTERINNEENRPSMFILKPEEINKRLSDNNQLIDQTTGNENDINEMSPDIEHFLSLGAAPASAPENDVLIISDDEENSTDPIDTIVNTTVLIRKNTKKKKMLIYKKNKINTIREKKNPKPSHNKITSKSPKTFVVKKIGYLRKVEDTAKPLNDLNKTSDMIEGLEETSRLLEDESVLLWNETERRQTEIIETFQVPEEMKLELTESLQDIKSLNDHLMDD